MIDDNLSYQVVEQNNKFYSLILVDDEIDDVIGPSVTLDEAIMKCEREILMLMYDRARI